MLTHRPLQLVLCGQGCTDEIPWLQNNRRVRSDHNHQVTATTDHEGTWESQGATRRAIRRIWNTGWGEEVNMGGSEWDLSMSQGHTHPVQVRRLRVLLGNKMSTPQDTTIQNRDGIICQAHPPDGIGKKRLPVERRGQAAAGKTKGY